MSLNPEEKGRFEGLLGQRVPPGPTYQELINEIHMRGFEVFLVGGAVRDVLSGREARDVDIVTTMPLRHAAQFLAPMFRLSDKLAKRAQTNGHLSLGGNGAMGDPTIDLCVFKFFAPGSTSVVFSDSFKSDARFRDFACNAVYLDPVNWVLIDPTGRGIEDAESRCLNLVIDYQNIPPYRVGMVFFRAIKFALRGMTLPVDQIELVRTQVCPCIPAMSAPQKIDMMHRHVLKWTPEDKHQDMLLQAREKCEELGLEGPWDINIKPLAPRILSKR